MPIQGIMNEGHGYVLLHVTPMQEAFVALHLDVDEYARRADRSMPLVSAALYLLGAMTCLPEAAPEHTRYRALFTTFFPRQWDYYMEFLTLAHTAGAGVEAYFCGRGSQFFVSNGFDSRAEDASLSIETDVIPQRMETMRDDIARIREFTELSDDYIFIPPPSHSVLKAPVG